MSSGWIDSQGTQHAGTPPQGYWIASDGRWYPPQGGFAPTATPKKRAKWPWILLGVFVLGLGGCVAILASAGESLSNAVDEMEQKEAAEKAAIEGAAKITDCRVDENGTGKASIEFTNPLDQEKGYISIQINFLEGTTVVGSGVAVFENLEAGEAAKADVTSYDIAGNPGSVTCKVADSTVL